MTVKQVLKLTMFYIGREELLKYSIFGGEDETIPKNFRIFGNFGFSANQRLHRFRLSCFVCQILFYQIIARLDFCDFRRLDFNCSEISIKKRIRKIITVCVFIKLIQRNRGQFSVDYIRSTVSIFIGKNISRIIRTFPCFRILLASTGNRKCKNRS